MDILQLHFGYKLKEISDYIAGEFFQIPLKRKKKNRRWVKKRLKSRAFKRVRYAPQPIIPNDDILVSEKDGIIYGSKRALEKIKDALPKIETDLYMSNINKTDGVIDE